MSNNNMQNQQNQEPTTKLVSITEAARLNNVTRQAIYVAIKLNKLKARKETTRWTIHLDDLEAYRNSKYSREKSIHNGELIFDKTKGFYSINQAARLLNIPAQKLYYATRIGALKGHRKGAAWVIHKNDLNEYAARHVGSSAASIA